MEAKLPRGTVLYRARVGFVSGEHGRIQPFQGTDIGAPPPRQRKSGRANAEGELVLYVADEEATAIAEVRPWRGLFVSVAQVQAARDVRIVDLSEAPPATNPFTDESPQYEVELEELLMAFGEELGRPLRRADNPSDYLPSQKLVRRIRQCGFYDGIRYPSAMSSRGTNVVLFDPTVVEIGIARLVEVREIGVTYGSPEEEVGTV
jgi:RES domain-containing protein